MKTRNLRSLNRHKETKRTKLIFLGLFLLLAVCFGSYYFIRHGIIVDEIVFIDNRHLRNDELMGLVRMKKNDELFGSAGRDIYFSLKRSPWIKDAVIRKELSGFRSGPGAGILKGRMLVKVTEAAPAAILSLSGIPFLIDREGTVLEQIRESALFLPVIKDIDPRTCGETYMEAVRFVDVLRDKRILTSGGSLEITGQRPEDITLKVDNIAIKMGAGDFEKKLDRLKLVRDEIQKRNMPVDYIDVRFANRIIVKPAGAAKTETMDRHGKEKQ